MMACSLIGFGMHSIVIFWLESLGPAEARVGRICYNAGGDPDAHNLPQPWVKMAMQSCAWSVLIQTLMVVAIPLVLGGEPKVSKDGTPEVEGDSMMAKVFTTLRYVAMAGMCSRYFGIRVSEEDVCRVLFSFIASSVPSILEHWNRNGVRYASDLAIPVARSLEVRRLHDGVRGCVLDGGPEVCVPRRRPSGVAGCGVHDEPVLPVLRGVLGYCRDHHVPAVLR